MMTSTTTRTSWLRAAPATMALAALGLTACAPEQVAEFEEDEPDSTQQPAEEQTSDESGDSGQPGESGEPETAEATTESSGSDDGEDVLIAEVDDPVTFEECEDAEESEDASVTWLEDVVAEEQRFEGVAAETVEIDGEQVEIPGVPDVVVPERVGQAGCIIEFDAPGNCLPAYEISSAYIPGYTIPERQLPQVQLPDGTVLDEEIMEESSVDAKNIEAVTVDEVCQEDGDQADAGEVVAGVTRPGITRSSVTQSGQTQSGVTRSGVTLDDGESVPYTSTDYISTDYLSLDHVTVDYETLPYYVLDGAEHTEYSERDDSVSYTTEGDVLFDSDEYELRSDAAPELEVIADDIAERDDNFVIEVEGHTDDLPTSVYDDNYELSELRAESVVDWLVDNAEVDEDIISAEGLGEDYPRTDNDSDEGRQQNRRVVITVQPEDYEPEVDYELEDAEE